MVVSTFILAIAEILRIVIMVYTWIIVIACVLSFVRPDPYNTLVVAIYRITEPVFNLVRKYIPTTFGGLDFAPIIILLVLQFIDKFFVRLMLQYAS